MAIPSLEPGPKKLFIRSTRLVLCPVKVKEERGRARAAVLHLTIVFGVYISVLCHGPHRRGERVRKGFCIFDARLVYELHENR